MTDKKVEENQIKDAVIDHLEQVVTQAREKLMLIRCPDHGQALKKLDMIKDQGRFDIDCCCSAGEKLVEEAIKTI